MTAPDAEADGDRRRPDGAGATSGEPGDGDPPRQGATAPDAPVDREPHRLPLTYPCAGASRPGRDAPPGFRPLDRTARIGRGRAAFEEAAATVMTWGLQRRSGIRVVAADGPLRTGDEAALRIPFWPQGAPCRVVYVVDEPRLAGFAYGTLPGHPERGEEAFLIERRDDDTVWVRIRAFSRPDGWIVALGSPLARLLQEVITRRYLRALTASASARRAARA